MCARMKKLSCTDLGGKECLQTTVQRQCHQWVLRDRRLVICRYPDRSGVYSSIVSVQLQCRLHIHCRYTAICWQCTCSLQKCFLRVWFNICTLQSAVCWQCMDSLHCTALKVHSTSVWVYSSMILELEFTGSIQAEI